MEEAQKEKQEYKVKHTEPAVIERKKFLGHGIDTEEIELKILTEEDIEDIVEVFKKVMVTIGNEELRGIREVLKEQLSFGAYVDRMLVGFILGWKICFDKDSKSIATCDNPNTLYMEDIAVLNEYEAKGVRKALLLEMEKVSKEKGIPFLLTIVGDNPKEEDIIKKIEEGGTKHTKLLLEKGYKFFKSEHGLVAYKKI